MGRARRTKQDGPDMQCIGNSLDDVQRNIRRIEIRENQKIGFALETGIREHTTTQSL
ncbi:hypothetical protein D9M69_534410 [compost metagenome]